MLKSAISDQKRLVRALHWQRARYYLRIKDAVSQHKWRLLTIAGPSPHEEVNCIRECMPKAHITAVDIVQANVEAAIDAGADEVFLCDIGEFEQIKYQYSKGLLPPKIFRNLKFDAICLDLTGGANRWLRGVVKIYYRKVLLGQGVMIVTLSYGRDVVEVHDWEWRKAENGYHARTLRWLNNIPVGLAKRVFYVLHSKSLHLDSCLSYLGNRMPMLSCLLVKRHAPLEQPATYAALEKGDYETALNGENLGDLLACPQQRLIDLRSKQTRSQAARKAAGTKRQQKQQLLLPGVRGARF
jgi:hypothetical protein